eukprot:GILJ01031568.1.p1 GENE.GILJ01031568.1~~GILJ01031568.1.p1  ORF type:complete len:232 (+),score=36.21 GILJ01031568.1:66-698(+)
MAASALFIVKAASSSFMVVGSESEAFGLLIVIGMSVGFVGDYLLDMKYIVTNQKSRDSLTLWGFRTFLVAHFFNASAVLSLAPVRQQLSVGTMALVAGAAVAMAAATIATEKLSQLNYGKFKQITFWYSVVIAFATLLAQASAWKMEVKSDLSAALSSLSLGLWLFMGSDVVLSHTYFGKDKNTTPYIIANYVLYYGGQWLIAGSASSML